jgi:hypothetical protein
MVMDRYVVACQQLLGQTSKQCRTSARTDGTLAEILNGHVLNTNQMLLLSVPLSPSFFKSINFQHSVYCPSNAYKQNEIKSSVSYRYCKNETQNRMWKNRLHKICIYIYIYIYVIFVWPCIISIHGKERSQLDATITVY